MYYPDAEHRQDGAREEEKIGQTERMHVHALPILAVVVWIDRYRLIGRRTSRCTFDSPMHLPCKTFPAFTDYPPRMQFTTYIYIYIRYVNIYIRYSTAYCKTYTVTITINHNYSYIHIRIYVSLREYFLQKYMTCDQRLKSVPSVFCIRLREMVARRKSSYRRRRSVLGFGKIVNATKITAALLRHYSFRLILIVRSVVNRFY